MREGAGKCRAGICKLTEQFPYSLTGEKSAFVRLKVSAWFMYTVCCLLKVCVSL